MQFMKVILLALIGQNKSSFIFSPRKGNSYEKPVKAQKIETISIDILEMVLTHKNKTK